MRQLSGLDASFLAMESASEFGHIATLTICDLNDWDDPSAFFEAILGVVKDRVHLLPLLRRRLVEVPLSLDHPYWVGDPDFDLEFHVRHAALPAPGSDTQLTDQLNRMVARPLDRSKPLWELYVIDGLARGRSAVLTKVHLAAIDGMQGIEVLGTLLDLHPSGRDDYEPTQRAWSGEAVPSSGELLVRTALTYAKNPVRASRLSRKALLAASGISKSASARKMPIIGNLLTAPGGPTVRRTLISPANDPERFPLLPTRNSPPTSFNQPITAHRRFAFGSVSLKTVRSIHTRFDVNVNDVLLAAVGGALRRYLLDRNELPIDSIVAAVPVYRLTGRDLDPYSHRVEPVLVSLHTEEPDPIERLKFIAEDLASDTHLADAAPATMLSDIEHFAPPAVAARAARVVTRTAVINRATQPFNLAVINVPGPANRLHLAGAIVEQSVPFLPLVNGQGLSIGMQSTATHVNVGVVTCRELVADPWQLLGLMTESVAELDERPVKRRR